MKIVLFDLGGTLESDRLGVLVPGAAEVLEAISDLSDPQGAPAILTLCSDFEMPVPPSTPEKIQRIREAYFEILDELCIRNFFEPVEARVTLSTEVGVFKPDPRVFRVSLDKLESGVTFEDAIFVTENEAHVRAARELGMRAIQVPAPGQTEGDVAELRGILPIVERFVAGHAPDGQRVAAIDSTPSIVRVGSVAAGDDVASASVGARTLGAFWVGLGDELLVYAQEEVASDASRRPAALPELDSTTRVDRRNLHLVVQKGRLFQKAHPHVPVLLDKGRFLVVDVDPGRAAEFAAAIEPCFTIEPLRPRTSPLRYVARPTARARRSDEITPLVDSVSRDGLEETLERLVSFHTRESSSADYREAASWVAEQLEGIGLAVTVSQVAIPGGAPDSQNVEAVRAGAGDAPQILMATAHLDSVNHENAGPAPGADDNASGSAGLLELARVLSCVDSDIELRFVFFGGEEQGLFGSRQYVEALSPNETERIAGVINMDMIGTLNQVPASVLLESSGIGHELVAGLQAAAQTYTELEVHTSTQPFGSDHVPFLQAGIPAVLTIEGADQVNVNEHSPRDTLDRVNIDFARQIVQMNVAYLAPVLLG